MWIINTVESRVVALSRGLCAAYSNANKICVCYTELWFKLSRVILVNMNSSSIQTRQIRSRYQFVMHIVCCHVSLYHSITLSLYISVWVYFFFIAAMVNQKKKKTLTFCPHMSSDTHISNVLFPHVFEQPLRRINNSAILLRANNWWINFIWMHWDWQLYFQCRKQSNPTPFDRHFIPLMPCGECILSYSFIRSYVHSNVYLQNNRFKE